MGKAENTIIGNFGTAKQYVDQAVKLCQREAVDLAKKIAENTKNNSLTQRQRDEAEQVEEQQEVNTDSLRMFKKLSKRLETNNNHDTFPYRLAVI